LKYRAEIDGLRALAVVPVILFHAGFELFSGGFVGIDIFFVISGYLITTMLIEDIEGNRFSLVKFYERRARRIFPALFFVTLCCIPFAWMWMLPPQMKSFSQSLVAVSLFASNILFWQESDNYFALASEQKPLLHTWSLAIEEQYYAVFPVFLFFAWRLGKNRVFWMLVVFAAASLALSEWGWRNKPSANFYLAPTRAWELFAGCIAAFIVQKRGVVANNALALAGFCTVLVSIFVFDEKTPFPSVYGLLAVCGVVLIVLFADKQTLVARMLSNRLLVGIGLISYSAYLWHQPLFAFARIQYLDKLNASVMLVLSALSIGIGFISWKYVENPFRHSKAVSKTRILVFSVLGILIMIAIGAIGHFRNGYVNPKNILTSNVEWASLDEKLDTVGDVCDRGRKLAGSNYLWGCHFGNKNSDKVVVLYGDSHARAISFALNEQFKKLDIKGFFVGIDECNTLPHFRADRNLAVLDCPTRFEELLEVIERQNADVILAGRWTFLLFPILGHIEDMPYRNSEGYIESDISYREYDVLIDGQFHRDEDTKKKYLMRFVKSFGKASRNLFLIYPVPETAIDIGKANRDYFNENDVLLEEVTTPYDDYVRRNNFVERVFDELSFDNLIRIKPGELFCDSVVRNRCMVQFDTVPLYYDDDHLSYAGAKIIVEKLVEKSDWIK
jgi:peptidoglycan/LPS O-acetylase OafA/YrhL